MPRRPTSVVPAPGPDRKWRTRPATPADHWADGWAYPIRLFLPIRRKARP